MKILLNIKNKVLYPACLYTVLISIILLMMSIGSVYPSIVWNVYLAIFCYCIVLSLSNLLLNAKRPNVVARVLMHFAINALSLAPAMKIAFGVSESLKNFQDDSNAISAKLYLVGYLLFIIIYFIIFTVRTLIRYIVSKKKQTSDEYKSMF